jgi:hypothetical protein
MRIHRSGSLLAALLLAATLSVQGLAAPRVSRPANLDRMLDRSTDRGLFRVKVASAVSPIPMNAIHRWTVEISDPSGRPVPGAMLSVDGGMPEHGHGLPTSPRAVPGNAAGKYTIQGLKFSMDGWWELKLAINAAGKSDKVTFNIVL